MLNKLCNELIIFQFVCNLVLATFVFMLLDGLFGSSTDPNLSVLVAFITTWINVEQRKLNKALNSKD